MADPVSALSIPFASPRPESTEQERAVGITVYRSPDAPGFQCTIKQRFTDFLVNEITPEGRVVHLTVVGTGVQGARGTKRANGEGLKEGTNGEEATEKSTGDGPAVKKQRTDGGEGEAAEEGTATQGDGADQEEPLESKQQRVERAIAEISAADREKLVSIFGAGKTQEVFDLYTAILSKPNKKPRDHPTVKTDVISDKSKRTDAHIAVRRIFASKLESSTMQDEAGVLAIKAAPPKRSAGAQARLDSAVDGEAIPRGKVGWNELGGEYLHFTLYKENKDTMEALFFIASQLKVNIKNFTFAGTKDRRGATAQKVAVYRVRAEQIARLNRMARGWRVGDFHYEKYGLGLGELQGNEFLLTLRDARFEGDEGLTMSQRLSLANDTLAKGTQSFGEGGFLNYYGLQRFGTFKIGTHVVGRKILSVDLQGAIDCILAYSEDMLPENQDTASDRKIPEDDIARADGIRCWRKGSHAKDALAKIPKRFQAEASIIQYLSKRDRKGDKLIQEHDWQGALMTIQKNLRLMYVHAYQSRVWNTVVSKRWELYGATVVEGDLVVVGEKDGDERKAKDEVDDEGEPVFHPAAGDSAPTVESAFTRARRLSKEEAESGKYTIFDVVLPLPGWDVIYPGNALGTFYEEFMGSEEGGGLDPHKMKRAWKDSSLSGDYRKMMARPGPALEFEVRAYQGDDLQMIETDLERVEKREAKEGAERRREDGEGEGEEADKVAVILKLQLGSSQYATMALRELTKGGAVNYKPEYSAR